MHNLFTNKIYLIIIFLSASFTSFSQEDYHIELEIEGFAGKEIIVAREFLNRYPVMDTLIQNTDGKFVFKGDSTLIAGVYLFVLPPNNDFLTFLVDEKDQHYSIKTKASNLAGEVSFIGSPNNKLYYDHLNFSNLQVGKLNALNESIELSHTAERIKEHTTAFEKELLALKNYREELLKNNKGLFAANLISLEMEKPIPSFDQLPKEHIPHAKYFYRKDHFFDLVDMGDNRLLHSEAMFNKIFYYLEELTAPHFDSLKVSIDNVLTLIKPADQTFKYYLDHLMIEYASSDVIGMDEIYIHIVENYFGKGMAPWIPKEDVDELLADALKRKPLLIGKLAPDILMEKKDGTPISLHEVKSPYTILYLWQPGCSHCKKSMPFLKDFYEKFKDRGVEIFSACTKVGSKTETCWSYIEENQMNEWINVVDKDLSSRFVQKYLAEKTPKIYILDENKHIVLKNFGTDQLEEIMIDLINQNQ